MTHFGLSLEIEDAFEEVTSPTYLVNTMAIKELS